MIVFGDDMDFDPANVEYQRKLTREITGREIGIALHGSTGMSADDLPKVQQRIKVLNGDGKASDITNL
ncbi:MAG: hypothetical protein O6939_05500 [Bacteroidetes bacterium]|nr:hypothetical protein [Bacteroidota bacterium]